MKSQTIQVSCDGRACDAYLSLPPTGRGPGLLLIQEIFGVNAHIRAVADQWAMDGYVVLAPDVFFRQASGTDLGYDATGFDTGLSLMRGHDLEQSVKDLAQAVNTLRARPELDGGVASLGFCMGGLLSFLSAAGAGVDAAVCYYGGGIQHQLAKAADIQVPMLLHFAEEDAYIPLQAVREVRAALADRPDTQVHTYPAVDHGFNCWERPMYNQKAAALARGRSLAFLSQII